MLIKEILLLTSCDLNQMKNFYQESLGLNILRTDKNSVTFSAGSSLLTFETDQTVSNPFYHFAFNIPSNKFIEAKEYIKSAGIELISLNGNDEFDFQSWNAHSIYFYDPAGNILEFISRHNLNNCSDLNFTGSSILSISEIGLPVGSVKSFYEEIESELGITFFSGDKDSFAAIGDDNGLFILVKTGRIWFPDCGKAKEFPAKIIIKSDRIKDLNKILYKYHIISETK